MMKNTKGNCKILFMGIKLDSTLTSYTRDFVISLKRYYAKKKRLSDKQFACLVEIYNSQSQKKEKKMKKVKKLF